MNAADLGGRTLVRSNHGHGRWSSDNPTHLRLSYRFGYTPTAPRSIHREFVGTEKTVAGAYKRWPLLRTSPCPTPLLATVHLSPPNDPMSIFVDGKLKPGRYKVQNLASQTYLEILEHSKELCCRPATVLAPKDALVLPEPSNDLNVSDASNFTVGIPTVGDWL